MDFECVRDLWDGRFGAYFELEPEQPWAKARARPKAIQTSVTNKSRVSHDQSPQISRLNDADRSKKLKRPQHISYPMRNGAFQAVYFGHMVTLYILKIYVQAGIRFFFWTMVIKANGTHLCGNLLAR